jgi:uncharacterized protein
MSESSRHTEVFHRLVQAVAARRQSEIVDDCFAEDVVVEHPFMVPEPTVLRGRDQLRERMVSLRTLPITMEVNDIIVHETSDPDVIVGEFQSRITSKQTGKQATTRNIMVMRFRDGKIISSRDYHNHALIAELAGSSR